MTLLLRKIAAARGLVLFATAVAVLAFSGCSPKKYDTVAASAAWTNVLAATQKTPLPAEWRTRQPSPEEIQTFRARHAERMLEGARVAQDFSTRFSWHSNASVAMQKEYELLGFAAGLGRTEAFARLDALEVVLSSDPLLPSEERFNLKVRTLERRAVAKQAEGSAAVLAEMERGTRELMREFPQRGELWSMLLIAAQGADSAKARAICQEVLAAAAAPEPVKMKARLQLEFLAFEGQPFDLAFTAVDGREIATSALRGKVLLIDFWATWCGPCVAELPKVKAAYNRLHAQGFEIIGVSLDNDRVQLDAFLKKENLAWPQHFDGKGWESELTARYKITAIPAMWLVDKSGVIRDVNARTDLEAKIERLMRE